MGGENLYIKTGFQADTASNQKAIAELEKGKKVALDVQSAINAAGNADVGGLARGFDKTTASIKQANNELDAFRKDLVQAAEEASSIKPGSPDSGGSGGNAPAAAKFRGAASLIGGSGAGELVGIVDDLQDAFEGFAQLKVALMGVQAAQTATAAASTVQATANTAVGVTSAAAAPGLFATAAGLGAVLLPLLPFAAIALAVAAAVAALVSEENKRAEALRQEMELRRAISDEIAAGATSEDIRDQIELLRTRSDLEQTTLEEGIQKYDEYIESVRSAFGGLGALLEPFVRLFGSYEEELANQVNVSTDLIDKNTKKEEAYAAALERGETAKADAAQAEDELARSREKSDREAEQAANKAQQAQEKQQQKAEQAQQKAQQEAEARAKEMAQLEQQRQDAAAKNTEAMKKINRTALDNIKDINTKAADAAIDGRNKLIGDLNSLTRQGNDDELNAAIKANRAEQTALKEHQRTIKSIMDQAASAEESARDNRNFLQLAQARRDAQKELNKQPGVFGEGADDRQDVFEQEREDRQRAQEIARRERNIAAQQEEMERKAGTERALRDNQTARTRQLREQAAAYNAEQSTFARHLQAMLSVRGQFMNAEMQMIQGGLNALRGGGRTEPAAPVSNQYTRIQRAYNTTNNISVVGSGGAIGAMRAAGFGR